MISDFFYFVFYRFVNEKQKKFLTVAFALNFYLSTFCDNHNHYNRNNENAVSCIAVGCSHIVICFLSVFVNNNVVVCFHNVCCYEKMRYIIIIIIILCVFVIFKSMYKYIA